MKILITGGGTSIPIDPVRQITNSSTGRFGAAIAKAALIANAEVTYLVSTLGQSPFCVSSDFYTKKMTEVVHEFEAVRDFAEQYRSHYREFRYQSFNEYACQLKQLVKEDQPDIIIMAAAVSDYLVANYSQQKIRSSENLTLHFEHAPKLIHYMKEWSPKSFVVGFKLLVDATEAELILAAKKSIEQHALDLVVANDLTSIKRGAHEMILVEPDGSFQKHSQELAKAVIQTTLKRWQA